VTTEGGTATLKAMDEIASSKKICPYPFSRMEAWGDRFIPCCNDWLTEEFRRLPVGDDPWNGPAAQELRRRLLNDDFSFCHTDRCRVKPIAIENLVRSFEIEAPVAIANRDAAMRGETAMPEGPTSIAIAQDPRCNLSCPSCRSQAIVKLDLRATKAVSEAEKILMRARPTLEILKLAGDGEVFFSPWMRELLKSLSKTDWPRLRAIQLLTNGTLYNEKTDRELQPGTQYIRRVSVSLDAGDSETYDKVRGGSWHRLQDNLDWMSRARQSGRFEYLQFNFTLRAENLNSARAFVELGRRLKVDNVKFTTFEYWPGSGTKWEDEAVQRQDHPRHQEFLELKAWASADKLVRWSVAEG
jgi:wyosine [tRNA(Phe)-imidazoG37] synthetase (radical SAM superfamily)